MSKSIKEERLRWVLAIVRGELKLKDVVKIAPYSQRSLEPWLAAYRGGGESALEPVSTRPKTNSKETSIHTKEQVIALRKKTDLCTLKLKWRLAKEGVIVHERTIGKILKAEGLVRKYPKKKIKYKYIKAEQKPGELIEIDVKYVPGKVAGRRYFQYTAIDCASRWRYLKIFENQSIYHSILFLQEVMKIFSHTIKVVKTDNHSIFTNYYLGLNKRSDLTVKTVHALDQFCASVGILHYLIDPGKPAQNGKVERSHREDQRRVYTNNTFKSLAGLQRKVRIWNTEYNDLEHCSLDGKTPNEFLENYKLTKPPNVYA